MKLNSTLDVKRFQRIGLFRELNGAGQDVWEWPKHGRGNLFNIPRHTNTTIHPLFGCMNATQVLFQLKFTSKQLEKMSKKAEKDQHKEEVKAKTNIQLRKT